MITKQVSPSELIVQALSRLYFTISYCILNTTGSTYGERPPLPISPSLTQFIDDFLERWRPSLITEANPSSSFLFLQPRTGNPLTPNSIYQIVSRCCYKYKQKKTNPHLLRDMIVTHIRKNSDASEKELEALALFMGHSVSMVSPILHCHCFYSLFISNLILILYIKNGK